MVTYSIEKRGQNDYYRFAFSNGKSKADKIIVEISDLHYFMYCLDNCYTFQKNSKTVTFSKQPEYTLMTISVPNWDPITYRLYNSEHDDLKECIRANGL